MSDTIPKFVAFVDELIPNMDNPSYWTFDKRTILTCNDPITMYPFLKLSFGCNTEDQLIDVFSDRYGIQLSQTQKDRFMRWLRLFLLKSKAGK